MRHRRGSGIPASDLLPLTVVASELTLPTWATAYEGGGGRAFTRPRGGRVARRPSSKQSKAKQDKGNKQQQN